MTDTRLTAGSKSEQFYNLYAYAIHFGRISERSQGSRWAFLYKIYRDHLWENAGHFEGNRWTVDYNTQEDWVRDLDSREIWEGGVSRSTFFDTVSLIDRSLAKGVRLKTVLKLVGSTPGALRMLVDGNVENVPSAAEDIAALSPREASNLARGTAGIPKKFMADNPVYHKETSVLEFSICTQDYNDGAYGAIEERDYCLRNIEAQDAEWLCKLAHRDVMVV